MQIDIQGASIPRPPGRATITGKPIAFAAVIKNMMAAGGIDAH
jgi:hypothetical protein